jgi:hypothetical protein
MDRGDRYLKIRRHTSEVLGDRWWAGCSGTSNARLVITALVVERQTPAEVARHSGVHQARHAEIPHAQHRRHPPGTALRASTGPGCRSCELGG